MTKEEVQISEIKNLDLIYVYSIDSIFKGEANKYVGAKVVFNKNMVLSFDYNDKYFESFIKKILDRYNKEKTKRKIILLGDLSKKLVNDSSFVIKNEDQDQKTQDFGMPAFSTPEVLVKQNDGYLKEAMRVILLLYRNYDVLKIDGISGYNHKYVVNYSVGSVQKQLPILIYDNQNGSLGFKVNRVENISAQIEGTLEKNGGNVIVKWHDQNDELEGHVIFDSQDNVIERKVAINGETILYDEQTDTLVDDDVSLLDFYFDLYGLEKPNHILKINDNAFLLSDLTTIDEDDDQVIYTDKTAEVNIHEDEALISYTIKSGFSKYNKQIGVILEEDKEDITLRKMDIEGKKCLLVERKHRNKNGGSYSYYVHEIKDDVDLSKPFNITRTYQVDEEIRSLEMAKKYIKVKKEGEV